MAERNSRSACPSSRLSSSRKGQTMQPATYTAVGAVVWAVCYQGNELGCWWGENLEETSGSAQASVSPAVAPTPVSVTPSSGAGPLQTFTFEYSSTAGAGDIQQTWQVLHATGATTNSCVVGLYTGSSTIVLWHDSGPGQDATATLGQGVVLSNSQCRVHVAGASQSTSGNTRTVVIPVEFTGTYSGPKNIYMWAFGSGNGAPTDKGDWTAR
jgi:hypothetical protein